MKSYGRFTVFLNERGDFRPQFENSKSAITFVLEVLDMICAHIWNLHIKAVTILKFEQISRTKNGGLRLPQLIHTWTYRGKRLRNFSPIGIK